MICESLNRLFSLGIQFVLQGMGGVFFIGVYIKCIPEPWSFIWI